MDVQSIKNRFGIVGNSLLLNRAIEIASQVAPTDMSVFISGESGSGKEVFSHIIHHLSTRKHGTFIAVNCGAIPEGTIDSELFGHEKGSFTGAHDARKGYFEVANGGTIFLDEVAELPLGTQARLLRILETGEYIRVGSSKVQKTDVRIVAATNVDLLDAVSKGRFREDLYYRLSTVPLKIPALRERKEDIYILFRRFMTNFVEKHRIPPIQLDEEAQQVLQAYRWPGNVRQLKNVAEQISILERDRNITTSVLLGYLPKETQSSSLIKLGADIPADEYTNERELLYKVLFDMKRDMIELKKLVYEMISTSSAVSFSESNPSAINKLFNDIQTFEDGGQMVTIQQPPSIVSPTNIVSISNKTNSETIEVDESLSLIDRESELIKKALKKYFGKRKLAAQELGISERTLYRKIKDLNLQDKDFS